MNGETMEEANRADTHSSAAMDKLRTEIHAFLQDPAKTRRCRAATRVALQEVAVFLKSDSDHVTAVWD
jgi:hypothetical protein